MVPESIRRQLANRNFTPKEFELLVKAFLDKSGESLEGYSSKHREILGGADGDYEIDVTARFPALYGEIVVLIECKKQKNRVKREVVQVLFDRLRAVGAHKGCIFSTAGFQSGAITYAQQHGICLAEVRSGIVVSRTKSYRADEAKDDQYSRELTLWAYCRSSDTEPPVLIEKSEDVRNLLGFGKGPVNVKDVTNS